MTDFGDLKLGTKFTNSLGQVFVYLPPGTFEMGSPITETGRDDDEGKNGTHTVELTDGFFMAIHETTQGPYQKITGEAPWKGQDYVREGTDYPATYVGWVDANDNFPKRLNETERAAGTLPPGWEYRLPTEAQWEYAARAGTQTPYSFGNDVSQLGKYAWFNDNAWDIDEKYAHRVGQKLPNKWGLYDMMGNVYELTADLNGDYPSGKVTNPTGGGYDVAVFRGGSFFNGSSYCRVADRPWSSPGGRAYALGFRLALVQVSSQ
jgi:formylglycine-generating enzyme required for sulfatase activity